MRVPITSLRALAISIAIVVPIGSFITRSVVDMPAWQLVGPVAWATFSRQADLRSGEVFYPIFGIGSTLLAVALAVVYRARHAALKSAAVPIYLAVLFAIGVMLATTQAAPQMLSLNHLGNDVAALQHALDTFARWQAIRTVCIVLGYLCNLWALVSIVGATPSSAHETR